MQKQSCDGGMALGSCVLSIIDILGTSLIKLCLKVIVVVKKLTKNGCIAWMVCKHLDWAIFDRVKVFIKTSENFVW